MSQAFPSLVTPQQEPSGAHFGGVYLDYNATTPVDPRVAGLMNQFLGPKFGNPASSHRRGRAAGAAVEKAAEQISRLVGCRSSEIVWTSGSTEAINAVIKGLSFDPPGGRKTIVASAAEHKAVLDSLRWVSGALGIRVLFADATKGGSVDVEAIRRLVDDDTFLVVGMAANNETGALTDVASVADSAHALGARYLCDTTQLAGKVEMEPFMMGVDYAVLSAHKMYGPQGVGALVAPQLVRRDLVPLLHGGGHQGGLRAGTLNLPGIVGFGEAAEIANEALSRGESDGVRRLRDSFERSLEAATVGTVIHGRDFPRLPNTSSVRFSGVDGEALVANMGEFAIATGSACTSAVPTPSHVLTSMGIPDEEASETVRISIGRFTSSDDLSRGVERLVSEVDRIRTLAR